MKFISLVFLFLFHSLVLVGQELVVQEKLILSAPLGKESLSRKLQIKNTDDKATTIEKLVLKGRQATDFHLTTAITFPLTINAEDSLTLNFTFKPVEKIGIHNASLEIHSPGLENNLAIVKLFGLAAQDIEGEHEPSLFMILKTLGYGVDIGGNQLEMSVGDQLLGDEIKVGQFVAASSDQVVELVPLARYSSSEQVPFGYFYEEDDQLMYGKVGSLSAEYLQHQTIYPRLASGKTSFNPGLNSFGIFISTASQVIYTKSILNSGLNHACRVFPLKNASGEVIENQYLICFEESNKGDYQDFVFILGNVRTTPTP